MTVDMTIRVQINLDEQGVGDPAPGDPLEQRMLDAAQQAVSNAVTFIEDNAGFEHELADLASVGFVGVQDCRRACDDRLSVLFDAMERHGNAEGTETQLGDAEDFMRLAFEHMSPAQQTEFLDSREVAEFITREGGEDGRQPEEPE